MGIRDLSWSKALMLAAVVAAAVPAPVAAQARTWIATTGRAATVPLAGSSTRARAQFVDITVSGFKPSPSGPVQIVVEAEIGDARPEIGRFAIYPERAFSPGDETTVQRFSLPVPTQIRLEQAINLVVRIVPSRGDGEGASVQLADARRANH